VVRREKRKESAAAGLFSADRHQRRKRSFSLYLGGKGKECQRLQKRRGMEELRRTTTGWPTGKRGRGGGGIYGIYEGKGRLNTESRSKEKDNPLEPDSGERGKNNSSIKK